MPADHRDVERRDAAVLVGGVERDAPLELVPVHVEGVGNRQRVRALDDRAVLAQFHQEAERGLEAGLAEEAPKGGLELSELAQTPAIQQGTLVGNADSV